MKTGYFTYRFQQDQPSASNISTTLQWTNSKTALVELLYALHAQHAINNGNTDLKELATFFQTIFNIDRGDYYRTFASIKMRKTNGGKFLESLHDKLLKSSDMADD